MDARCWQPSRDGISSTAVIPARWTGAKVFKKVRELDDFWEKVTRINWAMQHVIFGADDLWIEKGLKRTYFNQSDIDQYRDVGELIQGMALDQHGVYGFNWSHGAHLPDEPVLANFYSGEVSKYYNYIVTHGFEFLDRLANREGMDTAIATTVCLEECVIQQYGDQSMLQVASNYTINGCFIWEKAKADFESGVIPIENIVLKIPTANGSLIVHESVESMRQKYDLRTIRRGFG